MLKTRMLLTITVLTFILTSSRAQQQSLIDFGAQWKYLDNGTDQGKEWTKKDFDDTDWKSGAGQLGYGDDGEITKISYGSNPDEKYITTYFRHYLNIEKLKRHCGFNISLKYDDGAVIYVNGKEVKRINMPDNEITYKTKAFSGSGEIDFFLDKKYFRKGRNLIAVEIHQRNSKSSDIMFDMSMVSVQQEPGPFRKYPYLVFQGKNTEMSLYWQLHKSVSCQLKWGTSEKYSQGNIEINEFNEDHQYAHTFSSLIPGTKYFYQLKVKGEKFTGAFFSPSLDNDSNVKFMVYGDHRSRPKDHDSVVKAMIAEYKKNSGFQSIVFSSGDLLNRGDSEQCWDKEFFSQKYYNLREMYANVPLVASMGNHEGEGELFTKYLPYPYLRDHYWSFDIGSAHFILFDQYSESIEEELIWLEKDLESTKKPWKFMFFHEPGWSAGGHENNEFVQKKIQPICEQYNISVLFCGHNHYYARAEVNNVQHITAGGGGAPLYNPEKNYPHIVSSAKTHHYCKVEIENGRLSFSAVTPDGEIIDEFEINSIE